MLFNKKGDLAISTNAIVILIIAVIMLGLIIAFVTKGFGAVSDKFFGEIEKLPEPPTPSGSNPITFSEVVVGQQGEQFGLKIAIFNPTAGDVSDVKPKIDCANVINDAATQVNAKDIPSKKAVVFTYVGKLAANAPEGKQLCSVSAENLADAGSADLIIQVRK